MKELGLIDVRLRSASTQSLSGMARPLLDQWQMSSPDRVKQNTLIKLLLVNNLLLLLLTFLKFLTSHQLIKGCSISEIYCCRTQTFQICFNFIFILNSINTVTQIKPLLNQKVPKSTTRRRTVLIFQNERESCTLSEVTLNSNDFCSADQIGHSMYRRQYRQVQVPKYA